MLVLQVVVYYPASYHELQPSVSCRAVCCQTVDGQAAAHGSRAVGKVWCVEASKRFALPMASGRACEARCCCVQCCAVCSVLQCAVLCGVVSSPAAQRAAGHSVCSAVSAAGMQSILCSEQ